MKRSQFLTCVRRRDSCFRPDAELVTGVASRVLQSWLVGAESSLSDVTHATPRPAVSEFVRRIEEELERAKRFDLRLSLVLIDIPHSGAGLDRATSFDAGRGTQRAARIRRARHDER